MFRQSVEKELIMFQSALSSLCFIENNRCRLKLGSLGGGGEMYFTKQRKAHPRLRLVKDQQRYYRPNGSWVEGRGFV